jgi:hypothetical protein
MSGRSQSAHHTRRTILIAALAASVAALAAPTASKAGVFHASTSFNGSFPPTPFGWSWLALGLPKYAGPGTITDVTLTMIGDTGGSDYFPYDPESGIQVPGYTNSWQVPLFGPDNKNDLTGYPSVYVPPIDIPPTDQGCPYNPQYNPCYANTDFVSSPFGDNQPVADLSDYAGVGSNTFHLIDMAFDNMTLSMTLTETITTVPEPSTWTMMFLGFGLIGLLARRTARKTADS